MKTFLAGLVLSIFLLPGFITPAHAQFRSMDRDRDGDHDHDRSPDHFLYEGQIAVVSAGYGMSRRIVCRYDGFAGFGAPSDIVFLSPDSPPIEIDHETFQCVRRPSALFVLRHISDDEIFDRAIDGRLGACRIDVQRGGFGIGRIRLADVKVDLVIRGSQVIHSSEKVTLNIGDRDRDDDWMRGQGREIANRHFRVEMAERLREALHDGDCDLDTGFEIWDTYRPHINDIYLGHGHGHGHDRDRDDRDRDHDRRDDRDRCDYRDRRDRDRCFDDRHHDDDGGKRID